ncbi:MAG: hypothetical protein JXA72_02625 [Bacteroidales bacterium]|nr:hypothetical protein [Bacteroidales bacterium]
MKFCKLVILSLAAVIIIPSLSSCSSAKDVEERKNLMMPKKSEMPPNKRYREAEKRKLNKHKTPKRKNKKLF